MAIDRLINSTQGDSIIAALGSSGSIAQSLAVIAAKSNTPYNSDNKLNPSFIAYDTTHAAVTEAQRTQIGTNTTNIAWNTNNGVKNYLPINRGATTGAQYVFDWIAKDIPAGQYIISFTTTATSGAVAIEFGDSNAPSYNQTGYRVITLPAQSAEVAVGANTHYVRIYANVALTMSDIMLRPASISDSSYQPYALSNVELTAKNAVNENNISWLVDTGVKNLLDYGKIKTFNTLFTWSGNTGTYNGVTIKIESNAVKISASNASSTVHIYVSSETDTWKNGNTYRLMGVPQASVDNVNLNIQSGSPDYYTYYTKISNQEVTFPNVNTRIRFSIASGATFSEVTIPLMMCSVAAYSASSTYQSYALSNAELTTKERANENNILLIEQMNGAKNKLNFEAWKNCGVFNGTKTVNGNSFTLVASGEDCFTYYENSGPRQYPINARIPCNAEDKIVLTWEYTPLSSQSDDRIGIFANGSTSTGFFVLTSASDKKLEFTAPTGTTYISIRFGVRTSGNSATYGNIQIQSKASYDAGFTDYQPYAMSNAELTAPRTKLVYNNAHSASTTHKYTMNMSDFVYSQFDGTSTCGTYLISVVTWSTTPKHGLWIVSYSGGARSYAVLSNIVNPDAATVSVVTNVSDPYIEVTASGKVTISTLN